MVCGLFQCFFSTSSHNKRCRAANSSFLSSSCCLSSSILCKSSSLSCKAFAASLHTSMACSTRRWSLIRPSDSLTYLLLLQIFIRRLHGSASTPNAHISFVVAIFHGASLCPIPWLNQNKIRKHARNTSEHLRVVHTSGNNEARYTVSTRVRNTSTLAHMAPLPPPRQLLCATLKLLVDGGFGATLSRSASMVSPSTPHCVPRFGKHDRSCLTSIDVCIFPRTSHAGPVSSSATTAFPTDANLNAPSPMRKYGLDIQKRAKNPTRLSSKHSIDASVLTQTRQRMLGRQLHRSAAFGFHVCSRIPCRLFIFFHHATSSRPASWISTQSSTLLLPTQAVPRKAMVRWHEGELTVRLPQIDCTEHLRRALRGWCGQIVQQVCVSKMSDVIRNASAPALQPLSWTRMMHQPRCGGHASKSCSSHLAGRFHTSEALTSNNSRLTQRFKTTLSSNCPPLLAV